MIRKSILLAFALITLSISAEIPSGYYNRLDGLCGVNLKKAAKNIVRNHTAVNYGDDTWDAFKKTDVKIVNGKQAWWDMYSNEIVYVSSGHGGLNIEHSVANSWWGHTKNDAYKDLFHLNPSNANANSRKSNYPLGEIATGTWDNGVTFIGKPVSGQGGGATYVYEPADQYKGDFARVFMYMFTVYDDIAWEDQWDWMYDKGSELLLRPWAYNLLLKWDKQDPVSEKEINRNEAIYGIQHNRNPFIDLPGIGDYIWGSQNTTPYYPDNGEYTPQAPVFPDYRHLVGNEYSGTWWEPTDVLITAIDGIIRYSLDGAPYQEYDGTGVHITQGEAGQSHQIRAVTVRYDDDDNEYLSSVATLNLTAQNPDEDTPPVVTEGVWNLVKSESDLQAGELYVVTDYNGTTLMSSEISNTYFTCSGTPEYDTDRTTITTIPDDAAVITLIKDGGDWRLSLADAKGNAKGEIKSTKAKTVALAETAGGGSTVSISIASTSDGTSATIDFGTAGKLQYNASSPRFTTYTSSQQPLALYKYQKPVQPLARPTFYAIDQDGEEVTNGIFDSSCLVDINHPDADARILYTLDGNEPGADATGSTLQYTGPIEIETDTTIKAVALKDNQRSQVASQTYSKKATEINTAVADFLPVAVSGKNIIAPASARIFDVYGSERGAENLQPGIYIVTLGLRSVKVLVR